MCEKRINRLLSSFESDEEYLEKARLNRERSKPENEDNSWWEWYESVVLNTPRSVPLPTYIPVGQLPYVGKTRESLHITEEGG